MTNVPLGSGMLDTLLTFEDAQINKTATWAGTNTIDFGVGTADTDNAATVNGDILIDVTVCAVDGGDEAYTFFVTLANNDDMTTGSVVWTKVQIGDNAVIVGDTDMTTGTYRVPFSNVVNGVAYRYAKLGVTHVGATTDLTFAARIVKGAN